VECHTNSANSTLELLERQWSAKGNAEKSAPARLGYTVEEAAVALGIGRTAAYKAATTGELPTIRMGRLADSAASSTTPALGDARAVTVRYGRVALVPYSHQALAFDPAKAAERSALIGTAVPIQAGDPAYRHLVDVRGLDPAVVLAHPDLRCLHAPILGRPKTDSAFIALLRPAPGEDPTGCEVTFVDALGAKSATDPVRVCWNFIDHGCSRAWFWAGGGDTLILCEGFGARRSR
jgi:excisionase family DNA binding protein